MRASGSSARPLGVCFVCSGNICRSPFAEGLLRRIARDEGWADTVRVGSAGTLGLSALAAEHEAVECAGGFGVDLGAHRSRAVDESIMAASDVVLGIAKEHVSILRLRFPALESRVFLFGSFPCLDLEGCEIDDPIGMTPDYFREIFTRIASEMPRVALEMRRLAEVTYQGQP